MSNNKQEKEKKKDSFAKDALKVVKKAHSEINDVIKASKEVVDIISDLKDVVPTITLPKRGFNDDSTKINNGIIELIEALTNEYYQEFKDFCSEFIIFNYLDVKNVDKGVFIEKILDYVETYNLKNNSNYQDVLPTYANCLLPSISIFDKNGGREEKYFNKAEELAKQLKKDFQYDFNKAKDFTRIFVSLYLLKDGKREFDFDLTKENLNETIKRLKNTKSYKALLQRDRTIDDISVKYNKLVFVDMLLALVYFNMLSEKFESELN